MTLACSDFERLCVALRVGALEDDEAARMREHVSSCESCAAFDRESERALALATVPKPCAAPPGSWARLDAAVGEASSRGAQPELVISLTCTYCHDRLVREEAVFCGGCLAPHHSDCFLEHGRCGAPGCSSTRTVKAREAALRTKKRPLLPESPPRKARWVLPSVAVAVLAGALGAAALAGREAVKTAMREREAAEAGARAAAEAREAERRNQREDEARAEEMARRQAAAREAARAKQEADAARAETEARNETAREAASEDRTREERERAEAGKQAAVARKRNPLATAVVGEWVLLKRSTWANFYSPAGDPARPPVVDFRYTRVARIEGKRVSLRVLFGDPRVPPDLLEGEGDGTGGSIDSPRNDEPERPERFKAARRRGETSSCEDDLDLAGRSIRCIKTSYAYECHWCKGPCREKAVGGHGGFTAIVWTSPLVPIHNIVKTVIQDEECGVVQVLETVAFGAAESKKARPLSPGSWVITRYDHDPAGHFGNSCVVFQHDWVRDGEGGEPAVSTQLLDRMNDGKWGQPRERAVSTHEIVPHPLPRVLDTATEDLVVHGKTLRCVRTTSLWNDGTWITWTCPDLPIMDVVRQVIRDWNGVALGTREVIDFGPSGGAPKEGAQDPSPSDKASVAREAVPFAVGEWVKTKTVEKESTYWENVWVSAVGPEGARVSSQELKEDGEPIQDERGTPKETLPVLKRDSFDTAWGRFRTSSVTARFLLREGALGGPGTTLLWKVGIEDLKVQGKTIRCQRLDYVASERPFGPRYDWETWSVWTSPEVPVSNIVKMVVADPSGKVLKTVETTDYGWTGGGPKN